MKYYVYILECADKSLYVGCTNNLEKRLKQHNNSKWGARYTKIRRPAILKYSEKYEALVEARRREKEIKGWRREKKLDLINKFMDKEKFIEILDKFKKADKNYWDYISQFSSRFCNGHPIPKPIKMLNRDEIEKIKQLQKLVDDARQELYDFLVIK